MANQWVIPDIHACSKTLKHLIEHQIKPQKEDELYFLGDYIDRGPDSKGVLDYLISLENEDFKVGFLMGNHEEYLLNALKYEVPDEKHDASNKENKHKEAWLAHGGDTFLKSFGETNLTNIAGFYFDWIKALKRFIVLEKFVLVHAGLNFKPDNPFEDREAMLWIRNFEVDPARLNLRILIHGHVPRHIDHIRSSIKNKNNTVIDLDNGIYLRGKEGFGSLTAFELKSKILLTQENLDLP